MPSIRYVNQIALLLFFSIVSTAALAQTGKVSGRIVDESNHPVVGASVKVVSTNTGVSTDVDGRFTFTLATGKKFELEISAVGFTTKKISDIEAKANQVDELSISLASVTKNLKNVTVTTSARKESTNAL